MSASLPIRPQRGRASLGTAHAQPSHSGQAPLCCEGETQGLFSLELQQVTDRAALMTSGPVLLTDVGGQGLGYVIIQQTRGTVSSPNLQGQIDHSPTSRVSSTMLPRKRAGPPMPSAAAAQVQGQLSYSHDDSGARLLPATGSEGQGGRRCVSSL